MVHGLILQLTISGGNDRQRAFFDIGVFNPHAPLIPYPHAPLIPYPTCPSYPLPTCPSYPLPTCPSYPLPTCPSYPLPTCPSYPLPTCPSYPLPTCPSYCTKSPIQCYKMNEQEKKQPYEERVREIDSFAPLVFSTSGGMGPIGPTTVYKRMASLIAEKYNNAFLAKMQAEFLLTAICNKMHQRLEVLLSQTNKHV